MSTFIQTTLLTTLVGVSRMCELPGTNLQSLWTEFPPLITQNKSEGHSAVTGALYTGLSSMLKTCCDSNITVNWDVTVQNTRHLESTFGDQHDFALPVIRTVLFNSFTSRVPFWEYIPLLETPGPMLLKDDERSHNAVSMAVVGTWPLLILLLSSAAIAGVIMWALDRISNPEMFPRSFVKGFWEGIWWAYVTMTTVGYGDKTPKSIAGRLFGFVWIIVGIVMISIFTATLATAFTQDTGVDIRGLNIGVLNGSAEYLIAYTRGARTTEYETINDMIEALKKNQDLDGIVVDTFYALQHFAIMNERNIDIQGFIDGPATHGILFQGFSPDVVECLSKEAIKVRFLVYDEMIQSMGSIVKRSEEDDIWKKSQQLAHSNMEMTYSCIGILIAIFLVMILWEFVYWRPRNVIKQVPEDNEDKTIKVKETKT